jgi:hypothetical protein
VCDKHVHDLTHSSDPAGDVVRLGGRVCVRVLATALMLGGCSAADLSSEVLVPTVQPPPDAGSDASPEESLPFVGDVISVR